MNGQKHHSKSSTATEIDHPISGDKRILATCLACPEPCKQCAAVSMVACPRAGSQAAWENLPLVSEIGEGHGDNRAIDTMPRWLRVGLYEFSKPLSELEVEALLLWFAEVAEKKQRQQDKRDVLPPSGEVGSRVKITPKTLRRVTCPECGETFAPRSAAHKYCSDACARTAGRKLDTTLKRRRRTPAGQS